jgi:hypothetical protein
MVEFHLLYEEKGLMPGLYAKASSVLKRPEPTFLVPDSTEVTRAQKRFVIRVEKGTMAWQG